MNENRPTFNPADINSLRNMLIKPINPIKIRVDQECKNCMFESTCYDILKRERTKPIVCDTYWCKYPDVIVLDNEGE